MLHQIGPTIVGIACNPNVKNQNGIFLHGKLFLLLSIARNSHLPCVCRTVCALLGSTITVFCLLLLSVCLSVLSAHFYQCVIVSSTLHLSFLTRYTRRRCLFYLLSLLLRVRVQCNQMALLLFQFFAIKTRKFCPKSIKFLPK